MVRLSAQRLLEQAAAATGLDDFGPPTFRSGLDVLIESAETEANLNEAGRARLATMIQNRLENRLQLYAWHHAHPDIAECEVVQPVFVIGLWRTGTTILSYLLAADPERRSLRRWEAAAPCPPPGLDAAADRDRIARVAEVIDQQQRQNPRLAAINIQEPDGPTECVLTLSHEFKSQLFDTSLHIPSYYRWNRRVDQRSAYEHHRATLQLLQWKCPPHRWHLKAPAHTLSLDALCLAYPDAKFIVVHRDPAVSLASACDFWELQMQAFTDRVNTTALGRHWLQIYCDALSELERFLAAATSKSVAILQYAELRDPLGAIDRAYSQLGLPLTVDAEQRMASALANHRSGIHGRHEYSLQRYGLTESEVAEQFRPFVERMGIA